MVARSFRGFFRAIIPATVNWMSRSNTWSTIITMTTFKNREMMLMACPLMVMFRKIPNMWSGSKGIITLFIIMVMISPKSEKHFFNVSPWISDKPMPQQKAMSRAVITSTGAGISMVKYGFKVSAASLPVNCSAIPVSII